MDYAELAKRLRHLAKVQRTAFPDTSARTFDDAADAIEALTSPPDQAQVRDAAIEAFGNRDDDCDYRDALFYFAAGAAYRVMVKNEAKA